MTNEHDELIRKTEPLLFEVPGVTSMPIVINQSFNYVRKVYKLADARSFLLKVRHDDIYQSVGILWERGGRPLCEWLAREHLAPIYIDQIRMPPPIFSSLEDHQLLAWVWRMCFILLPAKSMWFSAMEYDNSGQVLIRTHDGMPTVDEDGVSTDGGGTKRRKAVVKMQGGYLVRTDKLPPNIPKKGQVLELANVLIKHAGQTLTEDDLNRILVAAKTAGELKSKQDPNRVFAYYKAELVSLGIL